MFKKNCFTINTIKLRLQNNLCSLYNNVFQSMATLLDRDENANRDNDIILSFLVHILKKWGDELNARPESIKSDPRGKLESATHTQTMTNLRPLMNQLKIHGCPVDIRCHLAKIIKLCVLDRDFVQVRN